MEVVFNYSNNNKRKKEATQKEGHFNKTSKIFALSQFQSLYISKSNYFHFLF